MSQHERVLQIAEQELGVHEQPMGSNRGPRIQVFQHASWLSGTGWPWCAAFFDFCTEKAGITLTYRGAGAYAWDAYARKQHWSVPLAKAVPGDGVVLNIGAGHMAIFKHLNKTTVTTIDGNWGDKVTEVDHPRSQVRGVVHVPEKHAAPAPPPPVFEIVTSASGHAVVVFTGGKAPLLQWLKTHAIKDKTLTIRPHKRKR